MLEDQNKTSIKTIVAYKKNSFLVLIPFVENGTEFSCNQSAEIKADGKTEIEE